VTGERIQKILAAAGLGSRRGIEEWLAAGRVKVNGRVARLGDRALATDQFEIDGKPVGELIVSQEKQSGDSYVLLYHKPLGEVTTRHDPQGRPTVFDRLPPPPAGRWVVVGRLDFNTTGLLLFSNDGTLAHRLMHPSFEAERRYLVRVRGTPDLQLPDRLLRGVMLEDGLARFDQIAPTGRSEGHAWYQVSLREGRNREVRRIFEAAGYEVSRLKRLAYGPWVLPEDLAPGQSRLIKAAEGPDLARFLR
jgi:23S rRNA pseudouridine2605 synthase